mgnify:CR=1 FL=1
MYLLYNIINKEIKERKGVLNVDLFKMLDELVEDINRGDHVDEVDMELCLMARQINLAKEVIEKEFEEMFE